jgi:hypothetical protein
MATRGAIQEGTLVLEFVARFISEDNILASCLNFPLRADAEPDRVSSATKPTGLIKKIKEYLKLNYRFWKNEAEDQMRMISTSARDGATPEVQN